MEEGNIDAARRRIGVVTRHLTAGGVPQPKYEKFAKLTGSLVMVGCGSIGQGVLPLLVRHVDIPRSRITVVSADNAGRHVAEELGISYRVVHLTRANIRDALRPLLLAHPGQSFLLNLSVEVASVSLITVAQECGALYLDTCVEPWEGGYTGKDLSVFEKSNYGQREQALELKETIGAKKGAPTALVTHGANPGMITHFLKQALLNIASDSGDPGIPRERRGEWTAWAELARRLGVKVLHVSERDTQVAREYRKERGVFANTWSVLGFMGEGRQPSELGWGTHEKVFPADGRRHDRGRQSAIYLEKPGMAVQVRSWAPIEGPFLGFLITHNESISMSDLLTLRDPATGAVAYRPTAHYAYHPCDDAVLSIHECAGKAWVGQSRVRLLVDELTEGIDELGILVMGPKRGSYWFGSQLSLADARRLAPHNSATTLQVTASVTAGVCWAIRNPRLGVVEPEDMDHEFAMRIILPYIQPVVGVYTDWTPLEHRGELFPEDVDTSDPWQFKNFRVS